MLPESLQQHSCHLAISPSTRDDAVGNCQFSLFSRIRNKVILIPFPGYAYAINLSVSWKLLFLFKSNFKSMNKCLPRIPKCSRSGVCSFVVCFTSSQILSEAIWKRKQMKSISSFCPQPCFLCSWSYPWPCRTRRSSHAWLLTFLDNVLPFFIHICKQMCSLISV